MHSHPSIRPSPDFDASRDAEGLRGAMKGLGCNNSKVVSILCGRSNQQRQEIAHKYKAMYGRDIISDLKSELSGDFEDLILALMEPSALYDAKQLHKAMKGLGTNEAILIEILSSRSNEQMAAIRRAYKELSGNELEDDIIGDTDGDFKRLLVSLCAGGRDESHNTDRLKANQDAHRLYKAGEGRLGTDEGTFNAILAGQNYAQIRLVFEEYEKMRGHPIEEALLSEFSDDVLAGFQAVVTVARNRPAYFARLINDSVKGFGTRDSDLIRLIVSRSEVDLQDVSHAYEAEFGTSLESAVKGDCSGAYKDGLLALIRGN